MDIHAFIEVDYSTKREPFQSAEEIKAINAGEFLFWQDVTVFNALGDVHQYHFPCDETVQRALIAPRGIPHQLSRDVLNRYSYVILEKGDVDEFNEQLSVSSPVLGAVSPQQADQWVKDDFSCYLPGRAQRYQGKFRIADKRVSAPDWHSASWLTLNEIIASLQAHGIILENYISSTKRPQLGMLVDLMQQLEKQIGTERTRLVFWFDN